MLQRIKKLTDISTNVKFNQVIEVNEAYIGVKLKNMHMNKRIALIDRQKMLYFAYGQNKPKAKKQLTA